MTGLVGSLIVDREPSGPLVGLDAPTFLDSRVLHASIPDVQLSLF